MMRASIMGASALTTRNLSAHDCLTLSGTYIQCVRWKRKPIWLPTAKSKVFRVPKRPEIPIEDKLELQRLSNNYRTLMKSLRYYFHTIEMAKLKRFDQGTRLKASNEDFIICSKLNDEWNTQVAKEREIRLAKEREERNEIIRQRLLAKEKRDAMIQEVVEKKVRKAKEEAPTFITADTIDEAIEKALENIVDHNTAIDLDGKIHVGTYIKTKGQLQSRQSST